MFRSRGEGWKNMRVLKVVVGTGRSIGRSKRIKEGTSTVSKQWGAWDVGSAVFVMSLFGRGGTEGKWKFKIPPYPLPAINPTLALSLLTLYQISEQKTSLSQRCWEQINNKRMIYFTWWFVLKLSICFL